MFQIIGQWWFYKIINSVKIRTITYPIDQWVFSTQGKSNFLMRTNFEMWHNSVSFVMIGLIVGTNIAILTRLTFSNWARIDGESLPRLYQVWIDPVSKSKRISVWLELRCSVFLKVTHFLEQIRMEHIELIRSSESELTFISIFSTEYYSRDWDIFEKPWFL